MKLFDTHCHLTDSKFDLDRTEVLRRMHNCGIEKAVVVGDATQSGDGLSDLCNENAFLYSAYGLHPHDAKHWDDTVNERISTFMSKPKTVALGEIGLDYHYDLSPRDIQKEVFVRQLEIAHELNKPVVMHIREAHGDAYTILSDCKRRGIKVKGVMHCFGGSLESATEYVKMGLFVSFSGSLTFKNTPILTRCAENLPLESLLIETDSPYMAPVPMRGKRNEPAYVSYVCEKLAIIKQMPEEQVADITYDNGLRAFEITQ